MKCLMGTGMIDHSDYEPFEDWFFLPLIRIIKHSCSGFLIRWLGSKAPSWTFQIINSWIFGRTRYEPSLLFSSKLNGLWLSSLCECYAWLTVNLFIKNMFSIYQPLFHSSGLPHCRYHTVCTCSPFRLSYIMLDWCINTPILSGNSTTKARCVYQVFGYY